MSDKLHQVAFKILENDINHFIKNLEKKLTKDTVKKIFPKVFIDVFVPINDDDFNKYEAPFSNLDFECNGLIYTKKGIHMSQSIHSFNNSYQDSYYPAIYNPLDSYQKMQKILNDIDNQHAIVVNTQISKQRIRKMIQKGWTISSNTFTLSPIIKSNNTNDLEEDNCIICHESFAPFNMNPNLGPAYKLYCCEAKYHMSCMIRTCTNNGPAAIQNTKTCIMCRKNTFIDDEQDFMRNVINEIKDLYNKSLITKLALPIPLPLTLPLQNETIPSASTEYELFPYLNQ
jgi:hypothetical protein